MKPPVPSDEGINQIQAAVQMNDANLLASTLKQFTGPDNAPEVAARAGIGYTTFWHILNSRRRPRLGTFLRVLNAFGLRMKIERKQ